MTSLTTDIKKPCVLICTDAIKVNKTLFTQFIVLQNRAVPNRQKLLFG